MKEPADLLGHPWLWTACAFIAIVIASVVFYFYPFSYYSMQITQAEVHCRPYDFARQHRQFEGSILPSGAYVKMPHWDRDIELWMDDDVSLGRICRVFGIYTAGAGMIHYNWNDGRFSAPAGMDGMQRAVYQYEMEIGFEYKPDEGQWYIYNARLLNMKSEKDQSIKIADIISGELTEIGDLIAPLLQAYPSHRASITLLVPNDILWSQIGSDVHYMVHRINEHCHYRGLMMAPSVNDQTQIIFRDLVIK